jgi:hypothetical protein
MQGTTTTDCVMVENACDRMLPDCQKDSWNCRTILDMNVNFDFFIQKGQNNVVDSNQKNKSCASFIEHLMQM